MGLLLLIFFGLPQSILYSQEPIRWMPFILIFIIQPLVLYYLLKSDTITRNTTIGLCALSVFIVGLPFGFYLNYSEKKDLEQKGETTKGVIYRKWHSSGKNSEWLIRCRFQVNGTSYSTFSEKDKNNVFKVGDTLTIIYINDFPQKCKIKELQENWN